MSLISMIQSVFQANAAILAAKAGDSGWSIRDFALTGGWVLIPIFFLFVFILTVFIERLFAIRKADIKDENYLNRVREFIHERKIEAALRLSQSTGTPVARMIEMGISRIGRPIADVNIALDKVRKIEVLKLERRLTGLRASSIAAPMFGFLGTVIGVMEAFYNLSITGGAVDIGILSDRIFASLMNTAAGLLVGIPAVFFYFILVSKIEKVGLVLETSSSEFMAFLNEPVKNSNKMIIPDTNNIAK